MKETIYINVHLSIKIAERVASSSTSCTTKPPQLTWGVGTTQESEGYCSGCTPTWSSSPRCWGARGGGVTSLCFNALAASSWPCCSN
eukprot:3622802-Amphidinium_carterae.2